MQDRYRSGFCGTEQLRGPVLSMVLERKTLKLYELGINGVFLVH